MSLLGSTTLRVASRLHPLRNAAQVRRYASGPSMPSSLKTSDVPWMAAAVVGTAGGLFFVANQDLGHADSKQAQAQHTSVETDNGNSTSDIQANSNATAKPSLADNKPDESAPDTQNGKSGEKIGQKKIDKKTDDSQSGAGRPDPGEEGGLVGHSPEESKKAMEPGAVSPDVSDKPDPRGKPKSMNETSGKQEGLSNADTHHTSQVSHQPEKSKKGEGVAETAKLKGTVSTNRPGPENKEERGKAQMDKDA